MSDEQYGQLISLARSEEISQYAHALEACDDPQLAARL